MLSHEPCRLPDELPPELRSILGNAPVYDSSCSPAAKVYFIDKDSGYYLKQAPKGALQKEAAMTAYFGAKGLGAQVVRYLPEQRDWMVTTAVPGETGLQYLPEPERLCDTLALELRKLHETDTAGCPIPDRTARYLAFAEENYQKGHCSGIPVPEPLCFSSPEEAHDVLVQGKGALCSKVLLHGDYCLPNVLFRDWKLSGFIDVGEGGVGERHIDLFWGTWTLWSNLKTTKYFSRFLDVYGRDKADEELLKIVAAAEFFG